MQTTDRSTRSSKRFVTEPPPNQELQSAPSDPGQFMCIECSETFDSKLELNSHRQSHVTRKQFMCSHCGRGFHHQVFLQMHERSHGGAISRTSLTKTTAGRVISTRSSKASADADLIHISPAPSKSSYHLNSKVEFKKELNAVPITPRECVTRRTQGMSPPSHQRSDSSDKKTQFELRISKLSDSTIHLIDPYGNTLEILAEVFNTYTIGEPEEAESESMSPTAGSEISVTPSTVHLNIQDEITEDSGLHSSPPAEVSEPSEPIDAAAMEEDLPLCHIESVSSASMSPKTVPDVSEDVLTTQSPCEPETLDVTDNKHLEEKPAAEISKSSTDYQVPPSSVQHSSITPDDNVPGGAIVVDVSNSEPAQTRDAEDDPNSEQFVHSEVLPGDPLNTENSSSLSKPIAPEPAINQDKDSSTPSDTSGNEKDPSQILPTSINEVDLSLDMNADNVQLDTSCVKDGQDPESDQIMNLSEIVPEIKMSQKSIPGGADLDEGDHLCPAELPPTNPDKGEAATLPEDGKTNLETALALDECVSESDEIPKVNTGDAGDLGQDCDLQIDQSIASIVCNNLGNSVKDGDDEENQATTKSQLELCLREVDNCRESQGVQGQVSPKSDVRSVDIADQRSVGSSDTEEGSLKRDLEETIHMSAEKQASCPIISLDVLPLIANATVPILEEMSPPEPYQEPLQDDHEADNKEDLISDDHSQNKGCGSKLIPESDFGMIPPFHDLHPQLSSNLEQDVKDKEMEVDICSSDTKDITSSNIEEKFQGLVQGEAPVVTSAEVLSLTNEENAIDEDFTQEDIQTSVQVTESDDEEKIASFQNIPLVESGEDNTTLLESKMLDTGDILPPPGDEDFTASEDDFLSMQNLLNFTSSSVNTQEHDFSQETKPTDQTMASIKSGEKVSSNLSEETTDLKDEVLFEKLDTEATGAALCLLEPNLDLSPALEVLSEQCLLSTDDVKDLVETDVDKNLSHEVPPKQYIQMSNADLTENDLSDDFVDPGTVLLDASSLEETTKEDDISAISVDDESAAHELSDILSSEIQDSEYTEGPDDKQMGVGGQCLKCGRRVRRGRKELVWFPICYKCRLKTKREERRSGEGACHSPDFVMETGLDRKKGSSDSSNFHIKQEADSVHDAGFYRTVKPVQNIKQESPTTLRKMYKCPKCEKSFRIPTLLTSHMKCHTLPQCLSCGCSIALNYKTKRIPKRCQKCLQKIKEQKKEERAAGGEEDSLESDSESLDQADVQSLTDNDPESDSILNSTEPVEDPKPGNIKKPIHSIYMRKNKKINPAIQALYCTCNVVLKAGARQPKICKNCQKPVRDRLSTLPKASSHVHGLAASGKVARLKKTKKPLPSKLLLGESSVSCDNELSPDDESGNEEEPEAFAELDTTEQAVSSDGEKPRLCPQCGKIFKCNRSMHLHLLSHTAIQCESCGCRLQKKKRGGRWSKKCRVCRLLTKDKGLSDIAAEEVLPSEKTLKEKNMASLRLKMKQSKIVRNRKVQSIAKSKKDLKWMNMIMAVKGLTRKPRKKKEQAMKNPNEEKSGYSSEPAASSSTEDKDPELQASQKKTLGGIPKVNRKCMYREKNIIKVEEQPQVPPYVGDPSSSQISVKEEEENQCLECSEVFPSFDLLLSHQQGHVKDQPFTCSQCPQSFSTEQYLATHSNLHAEGPPFRCLECNKTFTRRNHLGVHRRVHTGSRPYACPDCPCRFRQKGSLIIHRYTHRNLQFMMLKPYQCSVCNKSFKQKERLVIHERLHTGECPFSCKDCDKVFPSKSRLYVHRKIHRVPEPFELSETCKEESGALLYQCKDCNKVCSTKASFVLHRKVHKPSATCDQSSSREEKLGETTNETPLTSEHMDIKTEPEGHPFSCKDCSKVCTTKASLVLHRKVHGVDPKSDAGGPGFVCKDCHKVCSTKASLVLHRKVHKSPLMCDLKANIGDPPYTCQDCNKVCSTKASFVLHCKVHKSDQVLKSNLEQKSFVCKKCDFVCSTKASFVLHRKVHRSIPSLVQNLKDGSGEHPFTCKDCNKVCSTKASFVLHCKVHRALPASDQSLISEAEVEEKPYHCKDCGKIYSTKGRLLSHMKLHNGDNGAADGEQQLKMDAEEKPFACPVCHMRFTRLKILVRHKLLHGEDVFRCGHCGKRFLFHKSLMNHMPVCLKRSKAKSLLAKEKVPKKRKSKDGSGGEESAPKKRKTENKKAATAVQKMKHKKLIKAKKLAINKEKSKAKGSTEKKPKKPKVEAEPNLETESEKPSDGKPEKLQEEKEIGKEKKPKDVVKVKKVVKKIPPKQKRQKVSGESLKKWRIIAAATVKKRKLQAVISGGKKKVTVKKKGPSKPKTGGKGSKE
ncbi:uncharacterized protein RB166_006615 [Leptodactylus fuscus]|uniref:uncharacterized protein LOC142201061 n=1 Tax=Leptodactylus fuscus TaxID=238119 RepID=UPI003F4E7125